VIIDGVSVTGAVVVKIDDVHHDHERERRQR
jgi:hypothetical protein